MDYRGTFSIFLIGAAVLGSGAVASITGCGGPDPGAITFNERPSSSGSLDTGSSGTSASSGATGAADAGGTDAGGGGDFIFGTSVFVAGAAPKEANAQAAGADKHGTPPNVSGKSCMVDGCHNGVGAGGPTWAFAGTVMSAKTGGVPVAGAEVRIGTNGVEYGKAYTDQAGNFWLEKVAGEIPAGARVGVRKGTKTQSMVASVTGGGGCNAAGCHIMVPAPPANAQGFIVLEP